MNSFDAPVGGFAERLGFTTTKFVNGGFNPVLEVMAGHPFAGGQMGGLHVDIVFLARHRVGGDAGFGCRNRPLLYEAAGGMGVHASLR